MKFKPREEDVAKACHRYLTADEVRFVIATCLKYADLVSTASVHAPSASMTEAQLAEWFLGVCRDAVRGGSA